MRLLFLSMEHPTGDWQGGVGTYTATVTAALARRGHEVHVLSCGQQRASRDLLVDGVHVHHRPWLRIRGLHRITSPLVADRLQSALTCWVEARRLGWRPDVVEAPDWMAEGLLFTLTRRVPVVAHLHTPHLVLAEESGEALQRSDRVADRLERWAVRRAARVTAPAAILVDDLRRRGWLRPSQQVEVIRLPVDVARWSAVPSPAAAPPRVLVLGRLEARKSPELVLQALAALGESSAGTEVVFVGRSSGERGGAPYGEWLATVDPGRADVIFAGELDVEQLVQLLPGVRVVAVPSRYESFSLAVVEGMAAGRPVVATSGVGAAELLREPGAGRVVPVGDVAELARALSDYLTDPSLAEAEGQRCREVATRDCSADAVARQREALYDRVSRGRRS